MPVEGHTCRCGSKGSRVIGNPASRGNAYPQRLAVCSVYADQLTRDLIQWILSKYAAVDTVKITSGYWQNSQCILSKWSVHCKCLLSNVKRMFTAYLAVCASGEESCRMHGCIVFIMSGM